MNLTFESTIATINKYLRTLSAIITVIANIILSTTDQPNVVKYVTLALTIVTMFVNWWYNNNFTTAAQLGQGVTDMIKNNPECLKELYGSIKSELNDKED